MNKIHPITSALLIVFLCFAVFGIQSIKPTKANFMPMQIPQPAVVIRSDGSIDPATAPIQRNGNVYTFTDDIVGYTIASECNDIVIDGNGHSLTGNGNSAGVFILNRNGVTVKNLNVSKFSYGIRLIEDYYTAEASSDNVLLNNTVTDNVHGIDISSSSDNLLRNNVMVNNTYNFAVQGRYPQDIDDSNTVNGKSIIYWIKQENRVVPSDAGFVALVNCSCITVQDLSISNNGQGVILVSTINSTITNNKITIVRDAVYVGHSSGNTISENELRNSDNGINGQASSTNIISLNRIVNNENGIYFTGESTGNIFAQNYITENTVDGINLWGSTNTDIKDNTITNNNETGITFFESKNNRITENNITYNGDGIKLWFHTSDNNVSSNYVAKNIIGILLDDSYDNRIIGNLITENIDYGMQFVGSQNNNVIYHNNFVNNNIDGDGLQVSIPGYRGMGISDELLAGHGNVWDNGTAGNYWSDYLLRYSNATEVEGTGIGDTIFYINENNYDRYPLMEPASIPEFSFFATILLSFGAFAILLITCKQKMSKSKKGDQ
ncbi:MAG: right-handed parallel beta-helix repeat-containing protein [archaeon]